MGDRATENGSAFPEDAEFFIPRQAGPRSLGRSGLGAENRRVIRPFASIRDALLAVMAASILLVGLGALIAGWARPGTPTLDQVRAAARGMRFAEAAGLLERFLERDPTSETGWLLLAELSTEPSHADPSRALEALARIHPANRRTSATIKFLEGKARYQQARYDLAEPCWNEALRIDPTTPEAGWALLDLLDLEGRVEEAHRLGMRMHEVEPDPRDRVRVLLELARIDIDKVAPGSLVQLFTPLYALDPANLQTAVILGLAHIHNSQPEEGLAILARALEQYPDSLLAWDSWLSGLDDGHDIARLEREFHRLPPRFRNEPRIAKIEGIVAQNARDWPRAIAAYRRARELDPQDGVISYRLRQALYVAGNRHEAERITREFGEFQAAFKQLRAVYEKAVQIRTLGLRPELELYHQLAELREKMGRKDEARAWHRLILEDAPGDPTSMAALERLK